MVPNAHTKKQTKKSGTECVRSDGVAYNIVVTGVGWGCGSGGMRGAGMGVGRGTSSRSEVAWTVHVI